MNKPIKGFLLGVVTTAVLSTSGLALASNAGYFQDNGWWTPAAVWAKDHGLMNGMGDGTFGGEQPVTRGQLAQVLKNMADQGLITINKQPTTTPTPQVNNGTTTTTPATTPAQTPSTTPATQPPFETQPQPPMMTTNDKVNAAQNAFYSDLQNFVGTIFGGGTVALNGVDYPSDSSQEGRVAVVGFASNIVRDSNIIANHIRNSGKYNVTRMVQSGNTMDIYFKLK